jgi:hypothetical protein
LSQASSSFIYVGPSVSALGRQQRRQFGSKTNTLFVFAVVEGENEQPAVFQHASDSACHERVSLFWLALADRQDFVTPFIAFQAIFPSFCVVPYVTLLTRKPASAVILSAFLVGCMKMVAGVVVNLHFRDVWHNGDHELPWTEPNLMLSAFWATTAILSVSFLFLGANKYRAQLRCISKSPYAA